MQQFAALHLRNGTLGLENLFGETIFGLARAKLQLRVSLVHWGRLPVAALTTKSRLRVLALDLGLQVLPTCFLVVHLRPAIFADIRLSPLSHSLELALAS